MRNITMLFIALSVLVALTACGRPTTHLPATNEVGWAEFIVPSRTAPACTILVHQSALARVALDPKPMETNHDAELLAHLTEEAARPLIPQDPRQVNAPSVGCSAESILIALRSGHIVIVSSRSLTRDGVAVDLVSRRWFLADDGTLNPLIP